MNAPLYSKLVCLSIQNTRLNVVPSRFTVSFLVIRFIFGNKTGVNIPMKWV